LAEEKGLPLCTLCSACCGALTEANHEIKEDEIEILPKVLNLTECLFSILSGKD